MPRHLSYDERAERLSDADVLPPPAGSRLRVVREWAQENPEAARRYFDRLPRTDCEICRLYLLEGVTQEQVSDLLEIDQSVVSRRLHSSVDLLGVLVKCPARDQGQLGSDLEGLLPPDLAEAAALFCVHLSPSQVMDLLRVSESSAANKLTKVLAHLEKLVALPENGPYDATTLGTLALVGDDGVPLADDKVADRRRLASQYLEYLRLVKEKLRKLPHMSQRSTSRLRGPSIV